MSRKPFVVWSVDGTDYKLKLTTQGITKLEEKFKTNLMNLMGGDDMPALKNMLIVTHEALQKYHHGIKLNDVYDMFDQYVEAGGSQTDFMTNVFIQIYQVSGFLSEKMGEEMDEKLEEAQQTK